MAAALSYILVTLLPTNSGRVQFQALGIKLSGPAGQIVLWMVCFIVIAAAIRLLWQNDLY
jgi:hypothetical protein